MQVYEVGGAVRDALMGRASSDRDWVVVGASPEQMVALGYLPVGRDFPVFLHPETHEEYALARTERKTGLGYRGFTVFASREVSLEEDLQRRDLTINAMARDEKGHIIDPYGGQADLRAGVLRHVSIAFAEDPVRILRLARFAARHPQFTVADETLALMRQMVEVGEVDALVAERVWQELSRGLMEEKPSRMLQVLRDCGALARLLPEVDRLYGVPQPAQHHPEIDTGLHLELVLDEAAAKGYSLPVRYACLCHDLGKGTTRPEEWPRHIAHEARSKRLAGELGARLRVPSDCSATAQLVAAEHTNIHGSLSLGAQALMRLLERCDALRQSERFAHALQACACDARGRTGFEQSAYEQEPHLNAALNAVLALDCAPVIALAQARGETGPAIGAALRGARVQALQAWLDSRPASN